MLWLDFFDSSLSFPFPCSPVFFISTFSSVLLDHGSIEPTIMSPSIFRSLSAPSLVVYDIRSEQVLAMHPNDDDLFHLRDIEYRTKPCPPTNTQ